MSTPKQTANLMRGGIPANRETAARATAARVKNRESEEVLLALAESNPVMAMRQIHHEQSQAILTLLRSWNRKGGDPPKGLIDACKELRQLSLSLRARSLNNSLDTATDLLAALDASLGSSEPQSADGACGGCGSPLGVEITPASPHSPESADDGEPEGTLRQLYAELLRGVLRCSRAWRRSGLEPTRALIEASREFRLLAETIETVGAGKDEVRQEFDDFLANELPSRVQHLAGSGPHPPVCRNCPTGR